MLHLAGQCPTHRFRRPVRREKDETNTFRLARRASPWSILEIGPTFFFRNQSSDFSGGFTQYGPAGTFHVQ
jgi:hypothetical protein